MERRIIKYLVVILVAFLLASFSFTQSGIPKEEYKKRRMQLLGKRSKGVAILYSYSPREIHQTESPPSLNFFYLTGIALRNSFLVIIPKEKLSLLFVPTKRAQKLQKIREKTGIKYVLPKAEMKRFFKQILSEEKRFHIGRDHRRILKRYLPKRARIREDLTEKIERMRIIKSKAEIELMKKAAYATAMGLIRAMKEVKPGMREKDLQKIIENEFEKHTKTKRIAFPSIVAAGRSALELHHRPTSKKIRKRDLVLCDVGAEYEGYAADVTRTFPASGKFTKSQRRLYNIVLEAMKRVEKKLKAGVSLGRLSMIARDYIAKKGYFLGHGLSHFVGLSVHDVGVYGGRLRAGMVITIEPGIYLRGRGIGIRIEDTYLITKDGFERLSKMVPRDPDEIEKLMSNQK